MEVVAAIPMVITTRAKAGLVSEKRKIALRNHLWESLGVLLCRGSIAGANVTGTILTSAALGPIGHRSKSASNVAFRVELAMTQRWYGCAR
jgi:translation initiation factor 6 (eIF-6)